MGRSGELIEAGYKAGIESAPHILELIDLAIAEQPKWYQLRRRKKLPVKQTLTLPR
jgi:hypothetical protein